MTNFISLLRKSILGLDRYLAFLLIGWLFVTASLPLLQRVFGEQTFLQGWALLVLFQVLFVLQVLYRAWGWWSTLRVALGVVLFTWIAEAIGTHNGYPIVSYHYTSFLQPQVIGIPVVIPLMWLMMLPPAWAVAKLITRRLSGCLARPVFIITSALAFTAWGLYLIPQMSSWGLVEWDFSGGYFGLPWISLLGYLVVSGLISLTISPRRLPGGLLVLMYALTWFIGFTSLLLFWGLPGPALAGFFSMGSILLSAAFITR